MRATMNSAEESLTHPGEKSYKKSIKESPHKEKSEKEIPSSSPGGGRGEILEQFHPRPWGEGRTPF